MGDTIMGRRAFVRGGAAAAALAVSERASAEELKFFNLDAYFGRAAKAPQTRTALPLRTLTVPDLTSAEAGPSFVAGIRPYRDGGMRLAIGATAERANGSQVLIHNYGHGGAGVTLSFSAAETVRGFTEKLGQTTFAGKPMPPVAILGAGVIGLTTARALVERWPGLPITVFAKTCNVTETTSHLAGGQFAHAHSLPEYHTDAQQALLSRHLEASERILASLAGTRAASGYGIVRRTSYSLDPSVGGSVRLKLGRRILPAREYGSWLIDPTRLLPALRAELASRGVTFTTRSFGSEADVRALEAGIVVNCMGFGAREVFADTSLEGRRGHLVVLKNTRNAAYFLNSWCGETGLRYLFARHDDIVIGGTALKEFDHDAFDASNPSDVRTGDRLLKSARNLFDGHGSRCA